MQTDFPNVIQNVWHFVRTFHHKMPVAGLIISRISLPHRLVGSVVGVTPLSISSQNFYFFYTKVIQ